jgi:hypothetical protein
MISGIFLNIKDVQILLGFENYDSARKHLKAIRDALNKKSKYISIKEYCEHEELDFNYVWEFLRGKKSKNSEK